jgi:PE-PPE domain
LPGTNSYLPLLQPIVGIPVIGIPLADLVQPALTVLINLGYGSDNLGYSTPANEATPFGLFPDVNLGTVGTELIAAVQQGVTAFASDLLGASSVPAPATPATSLVTLATLPHLAAGLSAAAKDPATAVSASTIAAEITRIAEAITNAAVSLYNPLLPTAGIINALITTLPAYNVSLFLDNLSNPILAIGLPIAADVGLVTLMVAIDAQIWIGGIVGAIGWISTIFTPVSSSTTAATYQ